MNTKSDIRLCSSISQLKYNLHVDDILIDQQLMRKYSDYFDLHEPDNEGKYILPISDSALREFCWVLRAIEGQNDVVIWNPIDIIKLINIIGLKKDAVSIASAIIDSFEAQTHHYFYNDLDELVDIEEHDNEPQFARIILQKFAIRVFNHVRNKNSYTVIRLVGNARIAKKMTEYCPMVAIYPDQTLLVRLNIYTTCYFAPIADIISWCMRNINLAHKNYCQFVPELSMLMKHIRWNHCLGRQYLDVGSIFAEEKYHHIEHRKYVKYLIMLTYIVALNEDQPGAQKVNKIANLLGNNAFVDRDSLAKIVTYVHRSIKSE